MNKIFKVIWSHVTQTFVVVSELTRSKSKAKASVSDVKMNDVPSLITSGFKLTLISSLLISSIPTVYAAVAIDSMNRGFAFNNGTAKAGTNSAHYSYNYENPGNKNYVGQSDTSRYSGTLEASSGIAIGLNATTIASDNYSSGVAIGDNAMATGGLSFALGAYTQATAIGSTVIGTAGLASGFNSLAMMRQSAATNNYAMAIGTASWADGVASLAMGSSATARGKQSIAIGSSDMLAQNGGNGRALTKYDGTNNTQASGVRAIAIGTTARTSADDTIAIGTKTRILEKESGSIAIGNTAGTQGIKDTRADYLGYTPITIKDKVGNQQDKIAIGTNSYADGHDSIAIGTRAQAIFTNNAPSIGTSRNTENAGAVSIGYQSIAQGDQAVALGSRAEALNRQAMALGNDAFASGVGSIVIGGDDSLPHGSADTAGYQLTTGYNPNSAKFRPSAATGNGAVVVGVHSQALSQGSTAIGVAATAGDNDEVKTKDTVKTATAAKEATAVGAKSRAKSEHTTAVGYEAKAFGLNSTTVGAESTAESTNSFAGGYKATANGTNATAIGSSAQTKGDDAIAIGTGAKALNTNTISIGTGNTVTGANSTAIGDPTTISGTGSHSLGNDNIIPDDNSTVIGNSNVLSKGDWSSTSDGSHVVGNNVQIRGENSLAFGNNAMVGDANNEGVSGSVNATAIGTSATAKGANALAVGTGAKASKTNNTAIGTSATVTKDAGEDNIAFGSGATVTRGKNNVVIGKGSQADSLNGSSIAIGDGATIGNGVTGNGYAIGTGANIASTNGGIAFGNGAKITNSNGGDGSSVAIGEGAVATGTRAISLGHKANTDGNQVDSIAIGSSAKTSGNNNIAIGNNATAQGNQAEQIVIGTGANASGTSQYSIVMGSGAGATREHSTVLGSKANSIVDGGVALGANSVSDRQDGGSATGHRSTYEPYIPGTADPAQIEAINKTKGTTGAVSVGASATSSSPAILRQITNLAAGAEDTDAVNVAQLKAAVTTAVASSSWNIKENSTQKDVVNSGDNVSFANGTGTTATVEVTDSDKTSTVKYSVNKSNLNVATDGTVTAANTGDNFATADQVAQAINKSEKTTAINNSTTITAKPTTVGTVTTYDLDLTQETKDKIQQGIDANTTVNTKGITFTADNAGAKTERKLGETLAINGDKTLINTTVEAGKVSIAATDKLKTAVTNAESALQEIVTTVNGTTAQTVNKNSNKANFINGKNIELTPSKDGITVATKENVDFTTVNATTVNATTVNGNTIKSGNVVINQDGINAGGQTITNVKAGDKGTDAVNLNQLNEVKNTANAGWNLQANGQNGSNVKPNETVSLNNTDNNIVISKDANNDNVTFGLNSTLNIGNTKPIKIDGTTGTISGLVSTLPTSSTLTAQTKPTTTDAILSSAATVGDVLNSGWNLQGNSQAVDFVSAYDTVNFVSGSGTTAEVTVDAGKAASTVKYSVNKSDLTVAPNGTVTASNKGDNFATADQVAKAINDSEKTSSVVSSTKTIKVTSKVDGKNTEYDLDLSETTKTSLQNADNALQSWTAQANGQAVKTVSKDNATLNFVNGTNIQVTNDNGQVKIATVDAPTFTTVTAGTVNAENFTTGTVSITDNGINAGNQKITNLANGTANSDAVTLAQLNASKSVVQAGNNTHVRSETVTDGSTVYTVDANATTVSGSNALNITKSDAGNNVTNYALDLSDKTKGEIKQGVDANTTVNTKGLTFTADSGTDTLRKLGETLAINGDATLINTKVEAGKVSVVATKTLTDAVTNATSALQSIVTTADSKDAQTVNKDSNKANFISGTNIQLTGTKEGITVATKESVDFTTVNATTVNATTVNGDTIKSGDVVITKDGINAGNQTISNVKDGTISENSKEAVNGSQLYTTNQNVTNNTANITKNATDIAKGTVYEGDHAQTTTNEFKRALGEKTKVVGGAAKDDLSDNNIGVVSNGVDTLTVKLAKTLENLTNATFGSNSDKTVIDKDGVTITNGTEPNKTVSLTESGLNNGGQKITNVAKGEKDSDAVNVSQLKEYVGDNSYNWTISDGTKNEAVADNGIVSVKGSANDNSATTPGIVTTLTGTDITVDLSTKTKDDIKQGVDANTTVNTKGLTFTADNAGVKTERKLGETLAINGDATLINTKVEDGKVSVTATDKLQTAVTSAESALQSIITTANGVDAQTVNKNSNKANFTNGKNIVLTPSTTGIEVATKDEVDFTTVNATTLNGTTIKSGDVVITKDGINAGNQTISNVKDGTISENSKEAVNGSQLYATNQNVTNNTNNIAKNTADIAKGTVYAGDVGNSFTRPLGETTNVKGGATDNLSDNNIGVVSDGKDTLTVKLAKTLTDLTSAEFGEKDSSDKTVINKDGVSSEVTDKDGNVISSTDLTSDGVTSESVIPEVKTTSTNTADDGTTTQTDTTTDGLDTNEVSSQGMTVSTSTTETKTTTVTPKDGTTGPEITIVETDTLKTTGVDNDGIRINTHETVTTTNPDGTTNVVENGGEVSLTSSGLNNGGNRAINVAAGVNATDAVNVSQLEEARTHYYSVNTKTEQANFNNDTATGENSIAAGPNVWTQGVQSAVFGSMAGASSDKATAVGNDAWALGVQSTAIGSGVEAHGQGSVAIGNADNNGKDKTIATNEAINSVAIGTHAVVTKADTVAIGHNAGAVNTQATALGANANAAGEQSNALGYKSSASGNQSTAVGTEANAAGKEATALGYKANSNGYRTTAIGHSSSATGAMAVALGNQANARGNLSQAFGDHAIASAENATAIGTNANANAEKGIAFGTQAGVSGVSGIAFGDGAMSNAKQAISIGKSARTTAENAVALGSSAIATSNNAIAVGNSSNAIGANSLAMGANSKALKDNTIALGNNVSVTAANAVALGLNSTAYGENSIVMGTSAKNTGNHAVAIGTGASAYRQNSIAMGKDSSTGGDFAVALGDSANAAAENTLALGKNAIADKKDSVALGNNAYTGDVIATESATLAGQVYEFAGKAPIGTVSVGNQGNERTITNVAAGRISSTSTDAINGSQLYAVSEVASRGWNIQANADVASKVVPGATVQFIDGKNINITRDGNNITIATDANVVTTETDKYVTSGKVDYDNQGNGITTLTLK
ncbi:hypothetical protein LQU74_08785, partial [Actinobacillus pleuropneumoniae]|uniref:ESPR-type extended signal peptide-containing protein n=1 Tax=Actinobacillus pleuropneumoniae TaxID=715 RepID=UPI0020222E78